ncbi:MAG TPA: hypothetical protein PLG15_01065 [Candidatus Gastranaerophilaceae bacterium]|nr:hypothetical protein [Candidatus Gastranaerophilaceae bacterium]HPT40957.1 hypothetical protein [Candidatus Gastranaerophilaceae bacterium]
MITASSSAKNDTNGNGKYKPLRKRKKQASSEQVQDFVYLEKIDYRMRFNNSKDPIYFLFDCIEKKSVLQLTMEFIEDSLFEIKNLFAKE